MQTCTGRGGEKGKGGSPLTSSFSCQEFISFRQGGGEKKKEELPILLSLTLGLFCESAYMQKKKGASSSPLFHSNLMEKAGWGGNEKGRGGERTTNYIFFSNS